MTASILRDMGTAFHVAETLDAGATQAVDTLLPLSEVAEDMMRVTASVFQSNGRRGGGAWKPLKPETIKRKGSARILRSTDALVDSLTVPGAPFQILEIWNTAIVYGTDRPGAGAHQDGSPTTGLPKRPFLKFLPTDESRWHKMIVKHLMRPFRTSGV